MAQILNKYTISFQLGSSEVSKVVDFTTVDNAVDIDHAIVLITQKTDNVYSPTYCFITVKILSNGYQIQVDRGNSGGYIADIEAHIIEFDNSVWVQQIEGDIGLTTGVNINLPFSVATGKSFLILTSRTAEAGQDVHDFTLYGSLVNDVGGEYTQVYIGKYTNLKVSTFCLQIVEFTDVNDNVDEIYFSETQTKRVDAIVPNNPSIDKCVIVGSHRAIANWASTGYLRYWYVWDDNGTTKLSVNHAGDGSWISWAAVKIYIIKLINSTAQHFRVIDSTDLNIDTGIPVLQDSIAFGNCQCNYLSSQNDAYDDSYGSITIQTNTTDYSTLRILRNNNSPADFSISLLDLAIVNPTEDYIFHNICRGIMEGVNNGIN